MHPPPIMVTIGPVTLVIANALVSALADADAVGPDRHIGLRQRD
jgi:hypothetical protein